MPNPAVVNPVIDRLRKKIFVNGPPPKSVVIKPDEIDAIIDLAEKEKSRSTTIIDRERMRKQIEQGKVTMYNVQIIVVNESLKRDD